jgi:hypothetical protein
VASSNYQDILNQAKSPSNQQPDFSRNEKINTMIHHKQQKSNDSLPKQSDHSTLVINNRRYS